MTDEIESTMRAAVFHGRGDVRIKEVPVPRAGDGELLVEVTGAGICGTDAHEYAHGPIMFPVERRDEVTGHEGPMILGHEFAGRVAATGPGVADRWQGRTVAVGAGYACGTCKACRAQRPNLCSRYATVGLQRHGGLAGYCAVPVEACEDIGDEDLSPDEAALAQPASIAMHALRRGRVSAREHVVLVGAGGIGAFLVAGAAHIGAHVTVCDLDPDRLAIAAALGADEVVHVTDERPLAAYLGGLDDPPDAVYEVTGSHGVLRGLLDLDLRGTRIVLVGMQDGSLEVAFRAVTIAERELIGTNAHVRSIDLPAAIDLLSAPGRDWSVVAPEVLTLDELVTDGLAPLAQGRARRIKTLVDPQAERRRVFRGTADRVGGHA